MNDVRGSLTLAAVVAAVLLTGCAGPVSGAPIAAADTDTAVTTVTQPRQDCTEVTHADPWIIFEWDKDLKDGYRLPIGERGWFHGTAEGVQMSGPGAATMQEQSAATEIRCGVTVSSVSWVEVVGTSAGDVTLSWDNDPDKKITITIVPG